MTFPKLLCTWIIPKVLCCPWSHAHLAPLCWTTGDGGWWESTWSSVWSLATLLACFEGPAEDRGVADRLGLLMSRLLFPLWQGPRVPWDEDCSLLVALWGVMTSWGPSNPSLADLKFSAVIIFTYCVLHICSLFSYNQVFINADGRN